MNIRHNIIMGLDPSLSNTGITIIDNSTGVLKLKWTITFTTADKNRFMKDLKAQGIISTDILKDIKSKVERDSVNLKWQSYRLETISKFISEKIKEFEVDTIVLERQVRNKDLIAVNGAIRQVLGSLPKIEYHEFEPTRWKKMLTGMGNCDEKVLRGLVKSYYPKYAEMFNEHEVDAYCMILALAKEFDFVIKSVHGDGRK